LYHSQADHHDISSILQSTLCSFSQTVRPTKDLTLSAVLVWFWNCFQEYLVISLMFLASSLVTNSFDAAAREALCYCCAPQVIIIIIINNIIFFMPTSTKPVGLGN